MCIDQYSGKILAVQNPNQFSAGETPLNLLWPLHSGEVMGLASRILWCGMGLAPLILYVSGLTR
ncbi:MAG: PepSY domain-containing protein [Gammaproteobacteria bacterium]